MVINKADGAKLVVVVGIKVGKDRLGLFRSSVGGEIIVMGRIESEDVANGTADEVKLVATCLKALKEIPNSFGDKGSFVFDKASLNH